MKIIDKSRKDYYDCIQSYGQDERCVYLRIEREREHNKGDYWEWFDTAKERISELLYWPHQIRWSSRYVIGFCGKLYPCIYEKPSDSEYEGLDPRGFHYTTDALMNVMNLSGSEIREVLDKFFAMQDEELVGIFQEEKVPCFVVAPYNQPVVLNPLLKYYGFQRIKDPYTAYHEIYNYLSGVLAVTQDIPEMSNEIKIEQHGFDLKDSFRTPKGSSPKRKRKKK